MGQVITKTQRAKDLFAEGDLKRSLAIFKTFRSWLSKEEIRVLEIAYECLCGRESFYQALGIDTEHMIENSKSIITNKYTIR